MWENRILTCTVILMALFSSVTGNANVVYKSNAICDVSWVGNIGVAAFTQEQIFIFENAAAQDFSSTLEENKDDLLSKVATILSTSVNVMNSKTSMPPGTPALLKSTVAVTYLAHSEIPSMASLLQQASSGQEMDGIIEAIRIFDPEASSFSVTFVDPDDPSAEIVHILDSSTSKNHRSAADKGLIVATTCLSIMLIIVSGVLVWAAGGFQNLYTILKHGVPAPIVQFSNDVKHTVTNKFTSKDDDETASKDLAEVGILGAVSSNDQENAGVEVTPNRGLYNEDSSPLSQLTNSTMNTDATQHPLGIRSLRKLKRYLTPDKNNSKKDDGDNDKPKYDIKHLSSP